MLMVSAEPISIEKTSALGYVPAFILHTFIVYACAAYLSQWLVFHWFGWVAPIVHISTNIPPVDWYLRHFELMTILPALMMGYVDATRLLPPNTIRAYLPDRQHSIASWAWVLPTSVLLYRMLRYHAPASVLYGSSMTALKYFFDIQKVMPTFQNPLASDPIRVWAQFSVTAPFYAGVAYSVAASASKHQVLTKLFTFEEHDENTSREP